MRKIKIILLYFVLITFLHSCGGASDAAKVLKNEKITNTDEFLVQKKNPLVLPPDYDALPRPMSEQKVQRKKNIDDIDLSQVFSDSQNTSEKNSEIKSNKVIFNRKLKKKLKQINVNKKH